MKNKSYRILLGIVGILTGYHLLKPADIYSANNNQPCGNGVCQQSLGENSATCPTDCGSVIPPSPTTQTNPSPSPTSITTNPSPTSDTQPLPTSIPQVPGNSGSSSSGTSSNPIVPISSASYATPVINPYAPNPTGNTTPTLTGTASVGQGNIALIEYSSDDGATWHEALPIDGAFDSTTEAYRFTTPQLTEGNYAFLVRALNSEGIRTRPENYARMEVTIVTSPPSVRLNPITPNPTRNKTPTITATVISRFAAITRVDLSADNGKTWYPMLKSGSSYIRKLPALEDGNYPVIIRAVDSVGNNAISDPFTLIIDTIPPVPGGVQYAIGPRSINPNRNGLVTLMTGAESTIVISMKGGPTDVRVSDGDGTYAMQKDPESHLWVGKFRPTTEGYKTISVTASDGANNITRQKSGRVYVSPPGSVTDVLTGNGITNARISVYAFQSFSKNWKLWDAAIFGQNNPYITNDGSYSFFLPAGTYYLRIDAPGYRTIQSEKLLLTNTTAVNTRISLHPLTSLSLPFPLFGTNKIILPSYIPESIPANRLLLPGITEPEQEHVSITGLPTPDETIQILSDKEIRISSFTGKKLLLTFMTLWSLPSLEQAPVLSEVSRVTDGTEFVLAVAVQESASAIETFMKRGNYAFPIAADPYGKISRAYSVSVIPHHVFIDSKGIIRSTLFGVLTKNEILETFANLQ